LFATWRNSPGGQRGFTLLETLVVMLLLAVVAGALYSSYFTVVRAKERTDEGVEERRELRGTLDLLRREIDGAFFRGNDVRLRFVVEDRDIFGKSASSLEFAAVAPPRAGDLPASDLEKIRYAVKETDGTLSLTRESTELFGSVKPMPYPQMEAIEGFLVECYDAGKWVKTWNTELVPRLPERVRITIRVRQGDQTVEFTTLARPRGRQS